MTLRAAVHWTYAVVLKNVIYSLFSTTTGSNFCHFKAAETFVVTPYRRRILAAHGYGVFNLAVNACVRRACDVAAAIWSSLLSSTPLALRARSTIPPGVPVPPSWVGGAIEPVKTFTTHDGLSRQI